MDDQLRSKDELIKEISSLREELEKLKQFTSPKEEAFLNPENIQWKSEAALRILLENAQPVIFIIDNHGVFQVSEGSGLSVLGLKPGQVVGMSAYELYKDAPIIITSIKNALKGMSSRELVPLGHLVFDAFFSPYKDDHGNILGALGMAVNITDRVEALDQLQRMTQIVEQTTVGIIHTDADFKITYINQAAEDLYGWSMEEVIGKQPDIFNAEPTNNEIQAEIYTTVSKGETFHNQALNIRKDGSIFHCEMDISPITDTDGNNIGYMSVLKDVSEPIMAKQVLERKLSETSILQEISSIGATLIDEDQLITSITELLSKTFYGDHLGVMLLTPEGTELYPHPSYKGISPEDFSVRVKVGEGVSGKVIQTGKPIFLEDVTKYPDYISTYGELKSEICTPLIVSGKTIGVINVECKNPGIITEADLQLLTTIASQLATSIERTRLYRELLASNEELTTAYDRTLLGWANALELRDHETQGHTRRVTELAVKLAKAVTVEEPDLTHLRRGALLHDIGKIGIPDSILYKPGPLTEKEWEIMKQHPVYAYNLLAPIPFLQPALEIPQYHHEHWDGSGYPFGLSKEDIPLAARIFAIVDVWDALTSTRPYRPAWNKLRALDYIKDSVGSKFDPHLVPIFIKVLEENEIIT